MEQKSSEWYEARLGKFTSSELSKLMVSGRAKEQEFGDTALSYIKEKLHEHFTRGTCLDFGFQGNKATEWGEHFEGEAREYYELTTGIKIVESGFILSKESEMFGGSPDGLEDGPDGLIEIKCPYGSNHVKHLSYSTEQDLEQNEKEYYAQCQGNMIATGRKWCDFISYDPRYQNSLFRMKIIRVHRNEVFIEKALDKIKKAEKVFSDMLDGIINSQLQQSKTFYKVIEINC